MGRLYDTLASPDVLPTLRWQWLVDSPQGGSTEADIPDLTGGFPLVEHLSAAITLDLPAVGLLKLEAVVPTPPTWPASEGAPPLGGLALYASGELLCVRWMSPPLRPDTRSARVTILCQRGLRYAS